MSIADDPSQWSTPLEERSIPKRGDSAPERQRLLAFVGHTVDDYHTLRKTMNAIRVYTTSVYIEAAITDALDATPKDGCNV